MGISKNHTVLVVDDEEEMCLSLQEIVFSHGYPCVYTTNPAEVAGVLDSRDVHLVIMDIKMPGMGGIDLLKSIRKDNRHLPVIMITGYPSIENVVKAMKYGALNVYVKPLKIKKLMSEIRQVFDSLRIRKQWCDDTLIVTENPRMRELMKNIGKVAPTDATVLITGESGTGKELIASHIHRNSARSDKPLIRVNCAAIPDSLLESELFGHERGAFTNAVTDRTGKFELADGSTIFLDEIGDMSIRTQPKILRVLQDRTFERLGGNQVCRIDTRIISATNRDIGGLIERGLFREDLFYRLSVVNVELPPLRERREDLLPLSSYFIREFSRQYDRSVDRLSEEVKTIFIRHHWPGNIRELKNCIERAVIFCEGDVIEIDHLASQYRELGINYETNSFHDLQESMNRAIIAEALKKSGGNRQQAAQLLNITRKTLYNRMKKLGMA
jgi:two-component system response regulator AtoC